MDLYTEIGQQFKLQRFSIYAQTYGSSHINEKMRGISVYYQQINMHQMHFYSSHHTVKFYKYRHFRSEDKFLVLYSAKLIDIKI